MANINEEKFYKSLENIFVGANIEGEGGYINLLKIFTQLCNYHVNAGQNAMKIQQKKEDLL